jgi:hypothetical protein
MRLSTLAVLALLPGCGASATVVGDGDLETASRELPSFDGVELANEVDAEVTVGDAQSVALTCDANLLELIRTHVDGRGVLVIGTAENTSIRPSDGCVVDIAMPRLRSASLSGTGDLVAHGEGSGLETASVSGTGALVIDDVTTGILGLDMSGSGQLVVSGRAARIEADLSGSGTIDGRDVPATDAIVDLSGSGSLLLAVAGTVDVDISGSGTLELFGEPEHLDQTSTGSGTVIVHD